MPTSGFLLRHIHFRGISPFQRISAIQNHLVAQNLAHKASPTTVPAPPPTILTFTPNPVYTFGRRDPPESLNPTILKRLQKPLCYKPLFHKGVENIVPSRAPPSEVAEIAPTLRGGQTTFHGPGQFVFYPILDLKGTPVRGNGTKFPNGLDVRGYVHLLEETTINVLAKSKITATRTCDPGVWISASRAPAGIDSKIAALGIHLRRNITSYGLALNGTVDLRWFERIIPCGLEGKETTSISELTGPGFSPHSNRAFKQSEMFSRMWVMQFADNVWGQEQPDKVDSVRVNENIEGIGGVEGLLRVLDGLEMNGSDGNGKMTVIGEKARP